MWIRIRSADGPNLSIPVPLCLARSGILWRIVEKYGGQDVADYAPLAREMVCELRRYVRKHGHFCIIEVRSHDGDHIKITV